MFDALMVTVVSVINICLALLVLSRNVHSKLNRRFAAFIASLVVWTVLNFAADTASSNNLLLTRLTFASISIGMVALYLFSQIFPKELVIRHGRSSKIAMYLLVTMAVVLSMSSYVVSSVNKVGSGVEITTGPLYGLYILIIPVAAFLVFLNARAQYKNADVLERTQERYLYTGLIVYLLLAASAQLIVPIFFDSWTSSRLGPIFTLIFVWFSVLAIIRHKLFDIRLIVARSVGYILSIISIAALYGLIAFTLISQILFAPTVKISAAQQAVYTTLAVVIAFTFTPMKRFFDRITNSIFYRDAYDAQVLLNKFNEVIVSTIDLNQLLVSAGDVITTYLKAETLAFWVRDGTADDTRIISVSGTAPSTAVIKGIRSEVHAREEKVLITDMINDATDLRHLLQEGSIGMIIRITTDTKVEGSGYIVLGAKKSGNMYTSQDAANMEIIANELAIAIQNALQFEEIQKFNVTLQDRIDTATRKLQRTNEKLKQMDETKDEFISMASHQLRTPLTSVKGYLSMVLEGDAGEISEMQQKLLDQAFTSSQRMVYLIADLLNVSRLRTGKFVIEAVSSNLADVVEGELHQLKETAKARGLTLTYDKPENFPALMLDETKTRQVIMNFMDNAIYYSNPGGHINVLLKDKGDSVEYTVVDDGIGVPKAEQHHLFTKFYRAGNAKKARPDGTGLGLFMAKKVVVAQGGSIIFKSDPGKGSTFGFSFQKSKLQEAVDKANTENDTLPARHAGAETSENAAPVATETAPTNAAPEAVTDKSEPAEAKA